MFLCLCKRTCRPGCRDDYALTAPEKWSSVPTWAHPDPDDPNELGASQAGVLYPIFGILLSPVIAAAAMALSSVSVIGNAIRLRPARL